MHNNHFFFTNYDIAFYRLIFLSVLYSTFVVLLLLLFFFCVYHQNVVCPTFFSPVDERSWQIIDVLNKWSAEWISCFTHLLWISYTWNSHSMPMLFEKNETILSVHNVNHNIYFGSYFVRHWSLCRFIEIDKFYKIHCQTTMCPKYDHFTINRWHIQYSSIAFSPISLYLFFSFNNWMAFCDSNGIYNVYLFRSKSFDILNKLPTILYRVQTNERE